MKDRERDSFIHYFTTLVWARLKPGTRIHMPSNGPSCGPCQVHSRIHSYLLGLAEHEFGLTEECNKGLPLPRPWSIPPGNPKVKAVRATVPPVSNKDEVQECGVGVWAAVPLILNPAEPGRLPCPLARATADLPHSQQQRRICVLCITHFPGKEKRGWTNRIIFLSALH